ncbi:hypothetical protein GCM10025886_14060 [Tetragenococcus halophilus subsp. flandriensis]|uniref:hypothetical protein n=1 Tax=Tetragenococcus halophilus TaxID=51669 RepID=UPI0023E9BD92|nr:hypothetical protein [Tetragenococcus halophilus]GMA08255.1 hypothetical protein GCM10025886_14060 [Tetragenococcus halophilus subsp. flandriensis]
MSENLNTSKSVLCSVIENELRESKDKISRVRDIDGSDGRALKLIGQELEGIQDRLIRSERVLDDIRVLYYDSAGYESIH